MKVWIDLANSPHPLLFAPIARRLEAEGAEVAITVRDHAQTGELALQRWPEAAVIGTGRLARPRAILGRARELGRWARRERPDVALSHNAYAQIVAARALRIRAVTAMDYEHQPANHLAFRAAQTILLPEAVPQRAVRRQGARPGKVIRYPGLKEEVYLADFEPDPGIESMLGLDRSGGLGLAAARAAPAGAAYHRAENPLFEQALRVLSERGEHLVVVLARHPEQRRAIAALGFERVVIPEAAVDGRSLLWAADLFVGAGGTMTREAALLGTPTYSIFSGPQAAVDVLLERRGLLTHLRDPERLPAGRPGLAGQVGPAAAGGRSGRLEQLRLDGARIIEHFVAATLGRVPRVADDG